jgi:tripartite-type tricarboxylate transporter receptor subunit TctC
MITSVGMATNEALYAKLSYDSVQDLAPFSLLAVVPNVLVVNTAHSADKSVKDVLAHAKREPCKLTHACSGNSTSIHLAGKVFASMVKLQPLSIPYEGRGPTVTDQFDTAGAGRAPEQIFGASGVR